MKLLTRYPSSALVRPASCLVVRDASSTPAPRRASFLVRLPYYIFLACMGAVYYGYVVSLNLRWMILHQGYIWLSLTLLSIFHLLFIMFLWCLLATVYRGPGAVGEVLTSKIGSNQDLEAGLPSESAPLMQNIEETPSSTANEVSAVMDDPVSQDQAPRWRPRSSSNGQSHTSADDEESHVVQDYLELQPKIDYGDSSDEDAELTPNKRKEIEIIYPGTLSGTRSLMAKANGKARFCRKCNVAKPDRAHHCSTCGFCVLKMDHHCPWIGGCVGFKNYKTFVLFLFYADLLSIYTCATSLWELIQVLDMDVEELGIAPVGWGFLVLFGFLFSVMLTGFFPYHLYLALNNRSTIENMERNGRLLSLPARAETMLAAGVPDPHAASLPERPRSGAGQHLLPDHNQSKSRMTNGHAQPPPPGFADSSSSYRPSNPFLPSTNTNTSSASARLSSLQSNNALSSLSRMQARELERKAGKINIYDLGTWQANFKETFGSDWNSFSAWIPVGKSAGSGYEWPVNKGNFDRLQRINAQLRMPNNGM